MMLWVIADAMHGRETHFAAYPPAPSEISYD